jgi:hypothetical protein
VTFFDKVGALIVYRKWKSNEKDIIFLCYMNGRKQSQPREGQLSDKFTVRCIEELKNLKKAWCHHDVRNIPIMATHCGVKRGFAVTNLYIYRSQQFYLARMVTRSLYGTTDFFLERSKKTLTVFLKGSQLLRFNLRTGCREKAVHFPGRSNFILRNNSDIIQYQPVTLTNGDNRWLTGITIYKRIKSKSKKSNWWPS